MTLTEEDARNGVKHRPLTEGKMRSQVKPEFTGKRPSAPPPQGQPQTAPEGWRDNAGDPPVEVIDILPMSEREKQWKEFSDTVAKHLREYTVPQYGDVGEDAITDYTTKDCITQVEKYAKRFGSNAREGQQELDFIKIAHYVQCAWEKYEPESEHNDYGYTLIGYTSELPVSLLERDGLEFVNCHEVDGITHYFYRRIV